MGAMIEVDADVSKAKKKIEDLKKALDPKSGPKTTEFWITVVVGVLAQVVTAYGMYKSSDPIIAVGGIMTAAVAGAYSHSRGKAKGGA